MSNLTEKEKFFLTYVDQQLTNLDFTPLSDSQLKELCEKDAKAVTNAALEGIYESAFEAELNNIFLKHRTPYDLTHKYILESIDQGV